MTLTLTPQELRDLLGGRAVAFGTTDPDPLRDPALKPPPWDPDATTTTTPSPAPLTAPRSAINLAPQVNWAALQEDRTSGRRRKEKETT